MSADGWNEIERTVEAGDPDRFVAAFFAPAKHRRALIALAAFDHELARIGETVREPMVGHIRLGWWREQVAAIYEGRTPAAPVAVALTDAVRTYALPREPFDRAIDARARDLEEAPFESEAEHDVYADATAGSLMRLAAIVLAADAGEAVRHAATAASYASHWRAVPRLARLRRWRLPKQWLTDERVNVEDAFAEAISAATLERLAERAARCVKHALSAANAMAIPRAAMPALGIATLAYPISPISPWQRATRLARANLTRRL